MANRFGKLARSAALAASMAGAFSNNPQTGTQNISVAREQEERQNAEYIRSQQMAARAQRLTQAGAGALQAGGKVTQSVGKGVRQGERGARTTGRSALQSGAQLHDAAQLGSARLASLGVGAANSGNAQQKLAEQKNATRLGMRSGGLPGLNSMSQQSNGKEALGIEQAAQVIPLLRGFSRLIGQKKPGEGAGSPEEKAQELAKAAALQAIWFLVGPLVTTLGTVMLLIVLVIALIMAIKEAVGALGTFLF